METMNKPDKWLITFIIVMLVATSSLAVTAEAATLEVGPQGAGYPYTSIQEAINDSVGGDLVSVHDGTYMENINFNGKDITVKSINGAASTAIDGNAIGSVVAFRSAAGNTSYGVLNGFTITNGLASNGGGIVCPSDTEPTITNCIISGNKCYWGGGGIDCLSGSPSITNCTITNNSATLGGGIRCYGSSATITNCIISGNLVKVSSSGIKGQGGGIYCFNSSLTITNCTISNNTSDGNGGGIYCSFSSPTAVNSILWGNTAKSGNEIYLDTNGSIDITYSDIQGGYAGINNIDCKPLFLCGSDYHLVGSSPCINSGDNNATNLPLMDKDGQPRIIHGTVDMGAYEYTGEIVDYDATGTWSYSLSNEWIGGVCSWPRDMTGTLAITQTGDSVEAVDSYNWTTYTGTVSGRNSTVSGSYPESGGTTTVTVHLALCYSTSYSSYLTVHWTDGNYVCDGGADISITKVWDSTDSDDDGIPDSWEMDNFGDLETVDETTDCDNDGLLGKDEYANNTDPKDTDTDNDGIPDGYEVTNGLNPLVDDCNGDADGDGRTNCQEYLDGTDPNVFNFNLINITQDLEVTDDITITWGSVSGLVYQIASKDDYAGTFSAIDTVTASAASTSWTDDGTLTGLHPSVVQQRYYKVIQNGVDSGNIVGMYQITVTDGMNLISLPLVPFSTALEDVIGVQVTGADNIGESDLIWVWDGTKYTFAWLVDGTGSSLDGKWYTGNDPTTVQFGADQGAWLQIRPGHGPVDLRFVGEVSDTNRVISVVEGMNLVGTSFPYPTELTMSNLWESGFTGADNVGASDLIWNWVNDRYELIWLVDGVNDTLNGKWYIGNTPVIRNLEPGSGYWIQRREGQLPFDWVYLSQ